jgi:hypothetical protein
MSNSADSGEESEISSSELFSDESATETDNDDEDGRRASGRKSSRIKVQPNATTNLPLTRPRRSVAAPVSYEDPDSSSFDERISNSSNVSSQAEEESESDEGSEWVAMKIQTKSSSSSSSSSSSTSLSQDKRPRSGKNFHNDPSSPQNMRYSPNNTPRATFDMIQFWDGMAPFYNKLDGLEPQEVMNEIKTLTSLSQDYGGDNDIKDTGEVVSKKPSRQELQVLDIRDMVYVDDKDNEAFDKKMSGGHDNVSSSADSEDDCDVEEPSQHITTLITTAEGSAIVELSADNSRRIVGRTREWRNETSMDEMEESLMYYMIDENVIQDYLQVIKSENQQRTDLLLSHIEKEQMRVTSSHSSLEPRRPGGEDVLASDGNPLYPGLSSTSSTTSISYPLPFKIQEKQQQLIRIYKQLMATQRIKTSIVTGMVDRDPRFNKIQLEAANAGTNGGGNRGNLSNDGAPSYDEEDDVLCQVCYGGESEESNQILYCDRCNVPVHQSCYGIPNIPEGDFYCDLCEALHDHSANNKKKQAALFKEAMFCVLCGLRHGAMKPVVEVSSRGKRQRSSFEEDNEKQLPRQWVHVNCAMLSPNILIQNYRKFTIPTPPFYIPFF